MKKFKIITSDCKHPHGPAMSVIMLTPDTFETCRETLGYLKAQTIADRIEIIAVGPTVERLGVREGELDDFCCFQIVEIGEMVSTGAAFTAGARQARADVVAYGEEHSFPITTWAESLVERHKDGYAAVGFAMGNANPNSIVSWAHLYGQFCHVVYPIESGERDALGGHHTTYKTAALLEYGDDLPEMLNNETALHMDLRAKGEKLYLESAARSYHVNLAKTFPFMHLEYMGQKGFAAARARSGQWGLFKRLTYAAGFPLIPLVRMRRVSHHLKRTERTELSPKIYFAMLLPYLSGAVGEAMGYLFGNRRIVERNKISYELSRRSYQGDSAVPIDQLG